MHVISISWLLSTGMYFTILGGSGMDLVNSDEMGLYDEDSCIGKLHPPLHRASQVWHQLEVFWAQTQVPVPKTELILLSSQFNQHQTQLALHRGGGVC